MDIDVRQIEFVVTVIYSKGIENRIMVFKELQMQKNLLVWL